MADAIYATTDSTTTNKVLSEATSGDEAGSSTAGTAATSTESSLTEETSSISAANDSISNETENAAANTTQPSPANITEAEVLFNKDEKASVSKGFVIMGLTYSYAINTTDIAPAVTFSAGDMFKDADGAAIPDAKIIAATVVDTSIASASRNANTGVVSVTGLSQGQTTINVTAATGTAAAGDLIEYTGTVTVTVQGVYDIAQMSISGVRGSYPWAGTAIEPVPVIAKRNNVLVLGKDYILSYQRHTGPSVEGQPAILSITGIGAYAGSGTVREYTIEWPSLYLVDFKLWDANFDMTGATPVEISGTLDPEILKTPGDANNTYGKFVWYAALTFNQPLAMSSADDVLAELALGSVLSSANKDTTAYIDPNDPTTLIIRAQDKPTASSAQAFAVTTIAAKNASGFIPALYAASDAQKPIDERTSAYLTYDISAISSTGIRVAKIASVTGSATQAASVTYELKSISLIRCANQYRVLVNGAQLGSNFAFHSHTPQAFTAAATVTGLANNMTAALSAAGYTVTYDANALTFTITANVAVIGETLAFEFDQWPTSGAMRSADSALLAARVALNAAIAQAEAELARTDIVISTDGSDVLASENWVPQAKKDDLAGAITIAKAALGSSDATADTLVAAKIALAVAQDEYKAAVKPGTKSDVGAGDGNQGNYVNPGLIFSPASYTGSGSLTWRIDAPMEEFIEVRFGSLVLLPAYYSVSSGSTVITFSENYLKSLSPGSYIYQAIFKGGKVDLLVVIPAPSLGTGSDKGSETVNNSTTNNNTTNNNTTNNSTTTNNTTNNTTTTSQPPYYYYTTSASGTTSGSSTGTNSQATTSSQNATDDKDALESVPVAAARTSVPTLTGDGTATGVDSKSTISDIEVPQASAANADQQLLIYVLFGALALFMAGCAFFAGLYIATRKKVVA
ncbi:MAG: hypothetical protein LBG97_06295 [Coriobacteriales bacterium]|jgi:hypothetical protein|nr:hypothetical protein [Coriobacteriales bacterium]